MASEGLPNVWHLALRDRVLGWVSLPASQDEEVDLRKKPADLAYDVDETPPFAVQLGLSIQHIFMMSVGWLYVTVIADAMGATHSQAESLIQMSMLAGGLATMLQASRTKFGSGYFCPLSGSLSYMPPSIAAATSGGFPLLFGMIAAAGAFSTLLSRAIRKLRFLFPPEGTGLMIAMSGLQLISISCTRLVGLSGGVSHPGFRPLIVGLLTLMAMIVATIWLRGILHVMPMLLGLAVGFGASLALGVLPWQEFLHDFHEPWLSIPHRIPGGFAFSWVLLVPFLIASLTATLKAVGDLTLCQKSNDEDWKRTNMVSVGGGLFANGAGTLLAGLLGGAAQ